MDEQKKLTSSQLKKIESDRDLLIGNIERMAHCCYSDELMINFHFALRRLNSIYETSFTRFVIDNDD